MDHVRDSLEIDNLIKDLLLDSDKTLKEIAEYVDMSQVELGKRIKELGLTWAKSKTRNMSRGHAALYKMMQRLVPNERVIAEHPIGERLRLDIYCPSIGVAIEFHGIQHFQYVEHFHGNMKGFEESQARDSRKEELCKEQGITLIVFRYNDDLSEDVVFSRILEAINNDTRIKKIEKRPSRYKGNAFYEKAKEKNNQRRRELYRKIKDNKRGR